MGDSIKALSAAYTLNSRSEIIDFIRISIYIMYIRMQNAFGNFIIQKPTLS